MQNISVEEYRKRQKQYLKFTQEQTNNKYKEKYEKNVKAHIKAVEKHLLEKLNKEKPLMKTVAHQVL